MPSGGAPEAEVESAPPAAPVPLDPGLSVSTRGRFEALLATPTARWVIPGLLLLLGLVVRLWAAGNARFDSDESQFWQASLGIAEGRHFPILGHPISGTPAHHPGALFYYVMAIPQLFTRDPMAGSVLIGLLNLVGLWLFFLALREVWNERAAVIFLALAVASPWVVVYADRIWPGNVFFLMASLCLWCLVRMVRRERSRAVFALAILLVAGMQIHLSTLHLWVCTLVVLAVTRPRINVRWLLAGTLVGAALFVPYLVWELLHDFANTKAMLHYAPGGPLSWRLVAGLLLYFLGFATTDVGYLFSQGYWYHFDPLGFWSTAGVARTGDFYSRAGAPSLLWSYQVVSWLVVAAGLAFAVWLWWRKKHRWQALRAQPLAPAYLASLASIIVLYAISRKGGYPHYVTMLEPLAFLPAVLLLESALRRRGLRYVVVLYLVVAPLVGVLLLRGYYRRDSRMSIDQQEAIVSFILKKSGGRPFALGFAWRQGRGLSYQRLAADLFRRPWPVRRGASQMFVVLPRERLTGIQHRPGVVAVLPLKTLAVVKLEHR